MFKTRIFVDPQNDAFVPGERGDASVERRPVDRFARPMENALLIDLYEGRLRLRRGSRRFRLRERHFDLALGDEGGNREHHLASFAKNLRLVAKVFGQDVDEMAEADIRRFEERLAAIREKAKGHTALVGLVTSSHVNLLGNAARRSLIGNEFGFTNVAEKANANHGNEASFELLVRHDPDYFFVLDRDSAIARPGAKLAQDIQNNEMVDRMRAKKNDRIVYLTPAAWYLAEGGVKAMDSMFSDVEKALGLR